MKYIYEEDNKSALERLGRQGAFKSRALWSVRDGKGLKMVAPLAACTEEEQRCECVKPI
jgi:hypothetical protein